MFSLASANNNNSTIAFDDTLVDERGTHERSTLDKQRRIITHTTLPAGNTFIV